LDRQKRPGGKEGRIQKIVFEKKGVNPLHGCRARQNARRKVKGGELVGKLSIAGGEGHRREYPPIRREENMEKIGRWYPDRSYIYLFRKKFGGWNLGEGGKGRGNQSGGKRMRENFKN